MSESRCCRLFLCVLIALFLPVCAWGAVVPATVIAKVGDIHPGADSDPIDAVQFAFTNGQGQLGFTGSMQRTTGSDAFVWYDDGFAWFNSNDALLSGAAEYCMGIGDNGRYIYSVQYDGNDAVWTHDGLLLVKTDPSPGMAGRWVTFNSRPSMLPDGTAYWIAGLTSEEGGTETEGRVLYRSADTATPVITPVFKSGDQIGGFTVDAPSGVDFDYMVSDNGLHHIHDLFMDTGSSLNDGFVYVDGTLVAREGSPASGGTGGENWQYFDKVSINNAGTYLFSGDTDGDTVTDEYIACNGTIGLREGQTVDNVELTTPATVQGLAINNRNQAVHLWRVAVGDEDEAKHLFFAKSAANLDKSVRVLSTGDMIDVNGDGVGNYTVTDFLADYAAMRSGAWLAEDGNFFVGAEIESVLGTVKAIIRLSLPAGSGTQALPLLLLGD